MQTCCRVWRAPGMSIIATKRNIMIPNSNPDQRTWIFVAMLNDAASKAKPTKYAQNKCHGTNEGTACWMNCAAERCSAPKTANGMAKHKLPRATILSRPRAFVISVFAAHSAINRSTMLALPMENAVRENSKNARRVVECM